MINPINNNLNFKGFYERKGQDFSYLQNRVIDDIKIKLGDLIKTEDFMVGNGAIEDTVELIHFTDGLKQQGTGVNKRIVFNKGTDKLIGVYDENNTFELGDLNASNYLESSKKSDNTWKYVGWTIIALGALLIGNGAIKKCSGSAKENVIEKTISPINNSLNNLKKDSLNLFV